MSSSASSSSSSSPTNFANQEVVISELILLLVELSMYGTAYQILSVLLVLLLFRDLLELLIKATPTIVGEAFIFYL